MRNVHVSWECVTDGKTRDGANFKYLMEQLLDEGYQVDIETPSGKQPFTSKQTFDAWFDANEGDSQRVAQAVSSSGSSPTP